MQNDGQLLCVDEMLALIFERNSQLKNIQIFDKLEGDSSLLSFGQCFLGFSTHGNKITFI